MASIVRISFTKLLHNGHNVNLLSAKNRLNTSVVRCIQSKVIRDRHPVQKPKPYAYEDKNFNLLTSFFDKTSHRMDDNSKIIVVEGPVAAGKTKFAKQLADELDMLYLPEANLDMVYINDYGFDTRKLDEQLPESCRSFDINNFLVNPRHRLVASFQLQQYIVKYSQYIDALAHVLSTGQGVVLDRCVYSDFVFMEAMYSQKYLSKGARSVYYELRQCTITELLRPHLVIYLDIPMTKIRENIKKRNVSYEVSSPALTDDYLNCMEKFYKQHYLKDISAHSELLIYDWSAEGDVEIVVEDIERISFKRDERDEHDLKFADWVFYLEEELGWERHKFSDKKDRLLCYCNIPRFDVPELIINAEDAKIYHEVLESAPGGKYEKGFNVSMGDKNILFKLPKKNRLTLPRRERRFPL